MTTFAPLWMSATEKKAREAGLLLHHYVADGGDVIEVLDGSGTLYGSVTRRGRAWWASRAYTDPVKFVSVDNALVYAMGGGPLNQRLGRLLYGGGHLGRKPR